MLPGRRSPWVAILFTTVLALALIVVVRTQSDSTVVAALSGTTSLLLLAVFTIVNVCCLVLRREPTPERAFRGLTVVPIIGAVACAYLLGPVGAAGGGQIQYKIAAGLLGLGVVLWAFTWLTNRGVRAEEDRLPRHRAPRGLSPESQPGREATRPTKEVAGAYRRPSTVRVSLREPRSPGAR